MTDIEAFSHTGIRTYYQNLPIFPTSSPEEWEWSTVFWRKIERSVDNLHSLLYKAFKNGRFNMARKLSKLLLNSTGSILLNVRRVTQDNAGKKTAGVDGKKALDAKARKELVEEIIGLSKKKWKNYKARAIRRVYIPKTPTKKRPLGIPIIKDRAIQSVEKTALEPYWEAQFEANSYGFRPAHSAHDAIEAIFININRQKKWVLDADIKGCFDHIAHEPLLEKLKGFPGRRLIKQWLKADIIDNGKRHKTEEGTPQGGIISPLLANIALDGMDRFVLEKLKSHSKVAAKVVRYADDFVVLHEDKAIVELAKSYIQEWLASVGLELSEEKTKIVHTTDGFDFLGFNIRHYPKLKKGYIADKIQRQTRQDFTTLIQLAKGKVKAHIHELGEIIKKSRAVSAEELIGKLQPKITGFANYYRFCCYSDAFGKITHWLRHLLWVWAKRRHPNKGYRWVADKYFTLEKGKRWHFKDDKGNTLKYPKGTNRRYVKVREGKSYYDGDILYWGLRLSKGYGEITPSKAKMLKKQDGFCFYCQNQFKAEDKMESHHLIHKEDGGQDKYGNLALMHKHCHDQYHAEYIKLRDNLRRSQGYVKAGNMWIKFQD